jgi:copper(I)-binding protein
VDRTRRTRALSAATAAAALAASAVLAGCSVGFNATSIKPYSPSDGVMADSGNLRVLNALVVSSSGVSTGVVSAAIVNRGDQDDRLTGITSPAGTVDLTGDGTLASKETVRLGGDTNPSATISGLTRLPGETITLKLTFAKSDPLTIRTVVVPASGYYSTVTPGPTTPAE